MNTDAEIVRGQPSAIRMWLRALRVHQWLKNLLVFLPIVLAHRWRDWALLTNVGLAAAAFCLCASSAYLVNDFLDRDADRRHPSKRNRPLASGELAVRRGLAVAGALLVGAAAIAAQLNMQVTACLAIYYGLAIAYSAWIKRVAVIDVILLAALYTLRVLAGSAAAAIEPSFWLLAFSIFIFLSLALLLGLGPSAGFVAVLVLALYINSPESLVLYRHPKALWLICPLLLYWVTR